ncbi:MAG: pantoate--beta-alanine ligase [Bacteroidales bacterium]
MITFKKKKVLHEWTTDKKLSGQTIGFVPTMGALHTGHLALVERANKENDIVVCSIFVNPAQFNNQADLEKYPRNLTDDLQQLQEAGCDVAFTPDEQEIYPEKEQKVYDFGHLDKVMEGKYRPGHFNGVALVVDKLFRIVAPHRAYFGEKDFQQLQIIKALVRKEGHDVQIIDCLTVREPDGLALSSRNARLTEAGRREAAKIYQALLMARESWSDKSIDQIKQQVMAYINASPELKTEYFEIVQADTLLPAKEADTHNGNSVVACIAVYAGDVRLIDNMVLNS